MRIGALPSSLLVALGLAGCGPVVDAETAGDGTGSQGALTDVPPSTTPPDPTPPGTVGCLTQLETTTTTTTTTGGEDDENSVGCLSFIEDPTTGTDTDTDTDTGTTTTTTSGTSTGASSDSSTSPGADDDRGRILDRLHDSGVLPSDLLDRIKRR